MHTRCYAHTRRWQATRKRRQCDGGGDSGDKSGGEGGGEGGGNCGCEGSTRGDGGSHTHASLYTHVERWRATRERRQRDGGDDGGDEGVGEGGGKGGGKSGGCEAAHSGGGATAEERFERLESLERLERLESLAV